MSVPPYTEEVDDSGMQNGDTQLEHHSSNGTPRGLRTILSQSSTTSLHDRASESRNSAEQTSPNLLSPPISGRARPALRTPGRDVLRYSWQSVQDDAPTRPRIYIIKLLSDTTSSSAGFPGGEAFGFSFSARGRRIAVYNSARLYVLETAALPLGVSQDYSLKRRPIAVEILDHGNTMAVLADPHTANVYNFHDGCLQRTKTIKLDFPAACIALEATGGLLAAAYEGGIEVFSLDPEALPTDRRGVRCEKMDSLSFSDDGSSLLGTTRRINASATVVVSVPIFPSAADGKPTREELKEAWCGNILHAENIRDSDHAIFFRQHGQSCNDRLFAWNGCADTFGVLHVEDLQYGNIEFPVEISPPVSTCGGLGAAIHSCPTFDDAGETVAMIVNERTVRLYVVPTVAEDDPAIVEAHSIDHELDDGHGCPFTEVKWVQEAAPSDEQSTSKHGTLGGRLIVASPGGVMNSAPCLDEFDDDIEGGRVIIFDFDPQLASQPGQTFVLTLGKSPPQALEEAALDVATEVAIVRRRTMNQNKNGTFSQRPLPLGRSATTLGGARPRRSGSPRSPRNSTRHRRSVINVQPDTSSERTSLDSLDPQETLDVSYEPYAQNVPRSQVSLQRAASNVQRHRYQALEERDRERSGGLGWTDAETNPHLLALPEYTEEPNAPLPSRFRALAGLAPLQPSFPQRSATTAGGWSRPTFNEVSSSAGTANNFLREMIEEEQEEEPASIPASPTSQSLPTVQPERPQQEQEPQSMTLDGTGTSGSAATLPKSLYRAYATAAAAGFSLSATSDADRIHPLVTNVMRHSVLISDPVDREGTDDEDADDAATQRSVSPVEPLNEPQIALQESVSPDNMPSTSIRSASNASRESGPVAAAAASAERSRRTSSILMSSPSKQITRTSGRPMCRSSSVADLALLANEWRPEPPLKQDRQLHTSSGMGSRSSDDIRMVEEHDESARLKSSPRFKRKGRIEGRERRTKCSVM